MARSRRGKAKLPMMLGLGCLAFIVILAGGGVLAYLGFQKVMSSLVRDFTDGIPRTLPHVTLTKDEQANLNQRMEHFVTALDGSRGTGNAGGAVESLELDEKEVNALADQVPVFKKLKDQFHLRIENGQLMSEYSIPLEKLGLGQYRGRFLNGSTVLRPVFRDGRIHLDLGSLEFNGRHLPEAVRNQINRRFPVDRMLQEALRNPKIADKIDRIKSVEVQGEKLVLKLRKGG